MSIQNEVDRLIDERPGRELPNPAYDENALPLSDIIYRSAGTTATYDAVDSVHRETLAGMNAHKDIYTIMREMALPPRLRVGQGYGNPMGREHHLRGVHRLVPAPQHRRTLRLGPARGRRRAGASRRRRSHPRTHPGTG